MDPIGYSRKDELFRTRLIDEGVLAEDEHPCINWLEHAIRVAAGTPLPIDAYYRLPTLKDAPGYKYMYRSSSLSDDESD